MTGTAPRAGGRRWPRLALRGLLALCLVGSAGFDLLWSQNRNVTRGNELLAAGKAKEALAEFDRARARLPDDPGVRYDRALALAELGQHEEALQELARAAESRDPGLRSKAYFNQGNLHAKQEKWREAVESYKRALAADPRYFDAKWNLELALRKLKEQQEKEKKKQEEEKKKQEEQKKQQEEKKKQEEQKSPQSQPQSQPQPKPEDQKPKPQDQKQSQDQKPQQDQPQQGQKQQDQQQRDQKQQQPQPQPKPEAGQPQAAPERGQPRPAQARPGEREPVDAVLDALEKNQKNLPLERLRLRSRRRPEKDW